MELSTTESIKLRNRIETLGLTATLSNFTGQISASRLQMLTSHVSQAILPAQPNIPRILTGFETQLGDFTFNVKMPTDGIVKSVHRKYHNDVTFHHPIRNPTTTIVYQCQETGVYDYIEVQDYHSRHKTFGAKLNVVPDIERLRPGMSLPKGLMLAESTSVHAGGIFANGIETNVAYLSLPGTIEDGYIVSESWCKKAAPLEMSSSVVECGKKAYLLNIYGDADNYKPYPDIGDKVRDDGLVFALREYDPMLDAAEMTNQALMEVDHIHDIKVYGIAGAEVFDVLVESGIGESRNKVMTPKGMETQSVRYINQLSEYYNGIKASYDSIHRENPGGFKISPKLQALVVRALADKPNSVKGVNINGNTGTIRRTYKRNPLDEYRIEVRYVKRKVFDRGSKITGRAGNSIN